MVLPLPMDGYALREVEHIFGIPFEFNPGKSVEVRAKVCTKGLSIVNVILVRFSCGKRAHCIPIIGNEYQICSFLTRILIPVGAHLDGE
jgi:hypothetical protein